MGVNRFGGISAVDDVSLSWPRARSSASSAQRRRQDDAVRPRLRVPAARRRPGPARRPRHHPLAVADRAARGLGRLVPGRPAVPGADRRRGARGGHASGGSPCPRPAARRPSTCRRPTTRATGHRPGRRAGRAAGPRRLPLVVRARAVHRHPPHRRPGLPARPPAVGPPPRRAVDRHRPARGRGAGAAAAPDARRRRLEPSRHRARHAPGPADRRRAPPRWCCADPAVIAAYLGTDAAASIDRFRGAAPRGARHAVQHDPTVSPASGPIPAGAEAAPSAGSGRRSSPCWLVAGVVRPR